MSHYPWPYISIHLYSSLSSIQAGEYILGGKIHHNAYHVKFRLMNKAGKHWWLIMKSDFSEKFMIQSLTIKNFQYWLLSIRPVQVTLGCLVLSLKRSCPSLSQLTSEETNELADVFQFVETVLNSFVGHQKINYLCLMMIDAQVHFHVIPRYEGRRVMDGISFEDKAWPGPPDITSGKDDVKVIENIKNKISEIIERL